MLYIWQAITGKGGRFIEGPVSGSKKPAEDGQLIILAAGDKVQLKLYFWVDRLISTTVLAGLSTNYSYNLSVFNPFCKALFEESIPAFDVLGKKSFFLGQVGNGAKMKLIVNMIMGR